MRTIILSLLSLTHLALTTAQDYGTSPSSTSTTSTPASATADASTEVQTVQVGASGFVFSPDTITADKGDVIEFVIHTTHSVASSSFDNPCQPISGAGIWTGFPKDGTVFSVTINDTNPIWLYCAAPEHCQSGMAMVINPPSGGNTLAAYKSAASSVGNSGMPTSIQGGVFGAVSNNAPSSSSGGGGGSSSASSSASSAATSPSSSGNGAGDVTANAFLVGGVLFAAIAMVL